MNLVTLAEARLHCKADAADDAELTICVNAAEAMCIKMANRNIYATQELLAADLGGVSTSMVAANAAYVVAVAAAVNLIDADREFAEDLAASELRKAVGLNSAIVSGIVVTDDIKAAVLLTTAHLYANREEVIAGPAAAAVQLPMGAEVIMSMHRAIGPL